MTRQMTPLTRVVDAQPHPNRTTALVDRLLHHAHLILTDGDSIRLADAMAGKGVMPLA